MSIDLKQISTDYISYSNSDIWGSAKSIKAKEINHIYAPSGSGKTSFLKILYQVERSYSGSVLIDGRDLNDIDTSNLRTKHFSIVFQDLRLIPGLTGLDNAMLRAELFSKSKEEVISFFERLSINQLLNRRCDEMSRGELQKVAIIRSLIGDFDYLLLDEPFSHLDKTSRQLCITLIQEQQEVKGFSIILCNVEQDNFFPYNHRLAL
jgi:putative ABC transport system ATP-binding protein